MDYYGGVRKVLIYYSRFLAHEIEGVLVCK